MNRRLFLKQVSSALSLAALVARDARGATGTAPWRIFDLTTRIDIADVEGPTRLWLPVALAETTPWQRRLAIRWDAGGGHARLVTLPGYDVQLLQVDWPDAKSVGTVVLTSRVQTRDRVGILNGKPIPAGAEPAKVLQQYLKPTALLQTNGIVRATAERITSDHHDDIDKARALYEWVVDHTNRDPGTQGCGIGDAGAMLETGHLGGKCADINGLFVALARSVRIPARDVYGVRIADSRIGYRCLGKSGDVSKAQHCRAEFHSRAFGWVPVDPADVRKVVLEEPPGNLAMDDPKVRAVRERLFGSWEMNWVAYNRGHDVALPGATGKPIGFLMYPQCETGGRRVNSLDAAAFRYTITSSELTT